MNLGYTTMEDCIQIGDQLVVYCHNIEGILTAKLAFDYNSNVICLQETHSRNEEDLLSRGSIEGFDLVSALHSPVHVYVNINGTTVVNVYKPPSVTWSLVIILCVTYFY